MNFLNFLVPYPKTLPVINATTMGIWAPLWGLGFGTLLWDWGTTIGLEYHCGDLSISVILSRSSNEKFKISPIPYPVRRGHPIPIPLPLNLQPWNFYRRTRVQKLNKVDLRRQFMFNYTSVNGILCLSCDTEHSNRWETLLTSCC